MMPTQFPLRLLFLLSGLVLLAFGVVLAIRSNLGTSPISSVLYVYSFIVPLSVGTLTIMMHILMIVLQMIILGSQFQWHQWLQLPVGMVFGFLIDVILGLTLSWSFDHYTIQLLLCLLSCLITAFGVCLVLKANLVFLAGEGLYQAVAIRFNFNFGSCKTYGDIILVSIAGVSAYLCLHTIIGVREGTIMTALCVGSLVKMILPKLSFIDFNAVKPITSEK